MINEVIGLVNVILRKTSEVSSPLSMAVVLYSIKKEEYDVFVQKFGSSYNLIQLAFILASYSDFYVYNLSVRLIFIFFFPSPFGFHYR